MGTGTRATVLLEKHGIEHSLHAYDHDPSAPSYGLEAAQALGVAPEAVFKTLIALVDGRPVVGMVPVTGELDLKALAAAVGGKRAVMCPPADAERLTGYVVGGISPLGQRKQLTAALDDTAVGLVRIYVSGGRRGLDISLSPADLVRLTGAVTAPIGRRP